MALNKPVSLTDFPQKLASKKKGAVSAEGSWVPNTDVLLVENGLMVKVELAGMRREDLELSVEGNRIRLSGQRTDYGAGTKRKFLVMEINYGSFESVIDLPPGYDLSQARASYQNGFLRIEAPELPASAKGPKLVPITTSNGI